jgi:hypothetical protein
MSYWQLLGRTAILMTALCVGIYFYAKWDIQRFKESLGEPYTPVSQTIELTTNLAKQLLSETDEKQQETGSEMTNTAGEDASLDEFFNELGDKELNALLENLDTTDTAGDAFVDFSQEQTADSLEKDSNLIAIEGLDTTQTSEWIELGDLSLDDVINLIGDGDNVIFIGDGDNVIISEFENKKPNGNVNWVERWNATKPF